jgi:hypothetical protein
MRRCFLAAVIVGTVAVPPAARAGLLFDGSEFQINTFTTSGQYCTNGHAVARSADGNFVVVWSSYYQDGDDNSVHAQRFAGTGAPLGTEFRVNTYTTSAQRLPAVASASDGSFVVVWNSNGQDGSQFGVFGQRYDSAGMPVGTEFQINTYTTNFQSLPAVSMNDTGEFVVVWESIGQVGSRSIQGQRFDGTGAADGMEFQVNSYTTSSQYHPAVSVNPDGSFVIVWGSSAGQDGSASSIRGLRFDSTGAPNGTEFSVNTYTTSYQNRPMVSSRGDGSFVVVWASFGQDGSNFGVHGQRFDAAGAALGTEFQVNTYTTASQYRPAVSVSGDGGFVVVWESYSQDGGSGYTPASVYAQRFNSAGSSVGAEFRVNTYTTDAQFYAQSVAVDAGGDFVVVWASVQDGDGLGMFGQLLCQDANENLACDSVETTTTTTTSTTSTTSTTMPTPPCGPVPESDGACRLADGSGLGKSSLQIKNDADDSKDSFKWKWNKGVATLIGDFDTPTAAGSTYHLCVYDNSINPQPLLEADIPSGGVMPMCGTQPCWKSTGSTGFKYKNKGAMPDGITDVKLKAGAAAKTQVQIKGKGGLLGPPATGALLPGVVVQLIISDGVATECFKTTFSTFTLQTATQYKAKGP